MQPDHYSIVFARNHQFEELYERELQIRKMPFFPPFVRLIAFLIHGESEPLVRTAAATVAACCREIIAGICQSAGGQSPTGLEVLGPAPAPIDRLCDRYRWQVMIKVRQVEELHRVCSGVVIMAKRLAAGDTRISVDVDPENMM
jgi:primosomal protein N' (replication factor Y)